MCRYVMVVMAVGWVVSAAEILFLLAADRPFWK